MRSILGFAIIAVIAWIALNLVLSLLGFALGLAIKVLVWAAIGYCLFLLLKMVAPDMAAKVSGMVRGKPGA
ncbi:MAG: hypothetical protein WD934_09535 [Gemmatimonadales bacterium]|jgi:hypothetical protein